MLRLPDNGGPMDMPPQPMDMGGPEPPMEEPPMDEPPVDGNPEGGDSVEDDIMGAVKKLDAEKKIAVKKYAESMTNNDSSNEDMPEMGGPEPPLDPTNESRRYIDRMVNEISLELLGNDKKGTKRGEKEITADIDGNNPFVSGR